MNEHDRLLSFGGQPFTFIQNNSDTGELEEAVAWNFGLMAITTEGEQNRETRPFLYDALPQAQGAWQGQTVNHHEAVRRVLGKNLPAHLQPRGTCFPAGTEVLMADDSKVPIEQIKVGDEVVSHTGAPRKVLRVMERTYYEQMFEIDAGGNKLKLTAEHPVLTISQKKASWKEARYINKGDIVFCVTAVNKPEMEKCLSKKAYWVSEDEPLPYVDVTTTARQTSYWVNVMNVKSWLVNGITVYNLEVEEEHSYVAENVAVHNCGGRAGSRSAELLQLVKIASGINAEYKDVSHAWAYFLARRKYNMLRGGDGVAGGSIPEALEEGGYLTREESGDLAFAGRGSDDLAVKWGGGGLRGDELERFLTLAKDNLLVKRVRVRSAQELADGVAIGGVGICSDGQGYTTQRDSRGICRPQGTWWHYHVRSGVRRITQGVDIFQYDQSWGEDEPGGPLLEGCPGNVFGVEWAVQDRLCRSGEVDVLFDMQLWMSDKLTPDLPWVF